MLVDPGFQIRLDASELAILSRMGVMQESNVFEGPIEPVMTNAVCRKFYSLGPSPEVITERRAVDEARLQPGKSSVTIVNGDSTPWAQGRYMPSPEAVEAAHDPRYNDTVEKPSLNDNLTTAVPARGIGEFDTNIDATNASEGLIQELEAKVLCLEEEMLVHKKSGIEKDRRIRDLEQENERLRRGDGDLRASKRPRT